uniref:Uncharacterized protein n=1 Tax=Timema shepardi TaxID=629360 RepID=A0A7R9AVA9_TIMSH|nr:unnamed protein product [Timema shepardi]
MENHFVKTTLSATGRDSKLYLPAIGSLVYFKSSALDHVATDTGHVLLKSLLPEGVELTLGELQEMATRQQHQIDSQHQLLVAKEQRLRYLKQQEVRHQQVAAENERLRRLRDRVEAQELKLRKLRALRGQVDQTKLNNASLTLRPLALSSASLKPILGDDGRKGERRGTALQPTKVSFRANKNRWITETADGTSYRTVQLQSDSRLDAGNDVSPPLPRLYVMKRRLDHQKLVSDITPGSLSGE